MSCELTPKKRGTQEASKLFQDAFKITKDRELSSLVWAIAQEDSSMKELGIQVKGSQEPSVIEVIDAIEKSGEFLTEDSYPRYVATKENTNQQFSSIDEALLKAQDIDSKYDKVTSTIGEVGNKFMVEVNNNIRDNRVKKVKQLSLRELNRGLVNYLESLGFAVKTSDKIETAGMFSPLKADKNAEGLIEVIQIAKGESGQKALPEEFSHVLVEGMRNHPIMKQLFEVLNDEDVLETLLGDESDDYFNRYKGDKESMIHEVAAKLVAQSILDSYVENADVNYLANRAIKTIKNNLAKGSVEYIQSLIEEAKRLANEFINLDEDERVEYFDFDAVMKSKEMYNLAKNIDSMQEISKKAYELMNKRMKLLNLAKKNQTITPQQSKALKEIRDDIKKADYVSSCIDFLKYVLNDAKGLYEEIENVKSDISKARAGGAPTGQTLRKVCRILRNSESILSAYTDVVQQLASLKSNSNLSDGLADEDIESITEAAKEVKHALDDLLTYYTDARINTLWNFYQEYWGKDKTFKMANGENKLITLEDVLQGTVGDIGFSRQINAMCDLSDPLLQLVDYAYKNCCKDRDEKIYALQQRIATITKKYQDATGSRDTSFMFERDENGKVTGYLKSEYDFAAFRKAKHDYWMSIKGKGTPEETAALYSKWISENTEMVEVNKFTKQKERLPKLSKYKSASLSSLNPAQKEYYDKMMEIKEEMDALLPHKATHKYLAVQKKASITDSVMEGKATPKSILKRVKDKFIRDVSDTDYGEIHGEKQVILDFSQKENRKVPVYYTTRLDDMANLELSMSDALMSYGAMAYNYSTMNTIADAMELTSSLAADRDIVKTSGAKKLVERFGFNGEKFGGDYTIKGSQSGSYKKLTNYIDSNIYGRRKELQTAKIGKYEFDLGKAGDTLKGYSSIVGLGYNLFSGLTNLNMGIAQTLMQSFGGKYFGFKDIAVANKNYFKDIAGAVSDQYSDFKDNKLGLLIQKFDALEEFNQTFNETDFHSGVFKKVIGKHSPLVLNSMGEHYLHSLAMLAVLNNQKVKLNGKEVSLYEALEVTDKTDKSGTTYKDISIKEGAKNLDGSDFTEENLFKVRSIIQDVNHAMHGAFSDIDRGDIHRHVVGRLLMQFRQWMPAFYSDRFKGRRLNIKTGETEEGFYITTAGYLADVVRMKGRFATAFKNLSSEEQTNVKKAIWEVSLLYLLVLISKSAAGKPDKDDPWAVSMLKYNMYRLKMELSAAAPTSMDFLDNMKTLINSPIPCMENADRLISLLKVTDMTKTVESGKYMGWNKWVKNAYFATPYIKNINKVKDLAEGDITIFNPYLN